ncbi:MFS transporter [Lysinibacillus parviboronicapiens]|uniref:MFS transporter n=1 Tax=Lysinibacillus parviboronicapiens TaxID=436516 RepID=UPI000D3C3FB1|nr:MFS transporter [Lysinibacillus parviboronicapiens]
MSRKLSLSQTKILALYLLSISSFFASLNQNIYTPVIPLIRDSFSVSINWVNFTVSSFIIIIAMVQIFLGTVVDTKNQKRLLIFSFFLICISTIICAFTTNFMLFMVFRIVQAIGAGIIPLVTINMISHLFEGEARGSAMGTYQIVLTLAPAVSPILGGILGEHYGYQGIFLFLFLIAVILLMFIMYAFPNNGKRKDRKEKSSSFTQIYRAIFLNRVGFITMTVSFFIFFIYFAILVFLPLLLNDHYHVSMQNIGLLYLPLTVSMILGSVIFKKIQKKVALNKLFITVLFFMPLLIIAFGFLHTKSIIGLSILLFMYGLTVGFAPPLFSTVISNAYSEHRGAALGLFNFIRYAGMAIGGMFTGLSLVLPSTLIFIFLGVLLLLISLFQYPSLKNRTM